MRESIGDMGQIRRCTISIKEKKDIFGKNNYGIDEGKIANLVPYLSQIYNFGPSII